jgi:streptogramin lyase
VFEHENAATASPRVLFCYTTIATFIVALLGFAMPALASTDFLVPPGRQAEPNLVVVGPDHNLWFTEFTGEKIGRVTTSGAITEFKISGAQSLVGIANGPDGNVWFTDQFTGKVGHINTTGGQLTEYSLPAGSYPQGLTVGPYGNFWFVDQKKTGLFTIGKITTAGTITEYSGTVNAGVFQPYASAAQIATGADGKLWFTNPQAAGTAGRNFAGTITTAGTVTLYTTADLPAAIISGPDGNLWVTEGSHVAKITPLGMETEYAISRGSSGITVGPDGNLWFTEFRTLGKITTGGTLTEYPATTFSNFRLPGGIAAGPDGNLWFMGILSSNIGQVSTSGQLANTYALSNGSGPDWDTLDPDGAVWFSEFYANQIGRVSITGTVTSFPIKTQGSGPGGIVTGADGNLWFVEENVNQVAKITTRGTVTEYPLGTGFRGLWGMTLGARWEFVVHGIQPKARQQSRPHHHRPVPSRNTPLPTPSAFPFFITKGPDGNLWFTENGASQIGKIDPGAGAITEYSIGASKAPGPITAGPNGNLWFLENTASGAIGVINTSGALVAEYPVSLAGFPEGLVAGSDGALWLAQYYPNSIARVSTKGVVSLVQLTVSNAAGNDLAVGFDGKLWIVDAGAGEISRLSAIGGTGKTITPTRGIAFNGSVASFKDGTPTATNSDFAAAINWGDGTKSAGTVTGAQGRPFSVSGTHTYANSGTFPLVVTLTDSVDKSTYAASPGKAQVK